jgi:hypothetical protein
MIFSGFGGLSFMVFDKALVEDLRQRLPIL